MVYTFNPSTQEAKAGVTLEFEASQSYTVKPCPHKGQQNKTKNQKKEIVV